MSPVVQDESIASRTASSVAAAAQLACLLEVSAPKPGNVSPGRHFADARYEDFLASAVAIGAPLGEAGASPLGETIVRAVTATRAWTRSNTNLGMVLLLTPLARAACLGGALRDRLRDVLDESSVEDARNVYRAIRDAAPGGLGRVASQDVSAEPTVTLIEAMRMAADRDGIANEYVTAFERTFGWGVPALARARADGLEWDDAVVETFLTLLARFPDTHMARRAGLPAAIDLSRRTEEALVREVFARPKAGARSASSMPR